MLNAFCRVAPSLRLSFFAILPAGVFFRAIDFNVRTSVALQERRLPFFISYVPVVESVALTAMKVECQPFSGPNNGAWAHVGGENLSDPPSPQDDETENERLIKAADLVIITGMTLHNRTLPNLIEAAGTYNTSTAIWAITGRNFGHYYPRTASLASDMWGTKTARI
jgi:hypothetical protein